MGRVRIETTDAIKNVQDLVKELNTLKQVVDGIKSAKIDSFDKLSKSLSDMTKVMVKLKEQFRDLKTAINDNTKAQRNLGKEVNRNANLTKTSSKRMSALAAVTRRLGNLVKTNTKRLANNTRSLVRNAKAQSKAGESAKSFGRSLSVGRVALVLLIAQLFILGRKLFNISKNFDSMRYALEAITKTTWDYNGATQFLLRLSRDFGVELQSTTNRYVKFLAAAKQTGLTLKDTENIFRSLTKAGAVLGLKTDELRGIYLALEQMLSKGKITTEELRRQLGERLPGAMGIMASAIGVTIPELDKMMKKGQVLSAEVLPAFGDAVEANFGIEQIDRVETLQATVGRFDAAWQEFVFNFAESNNLFLKSIGWVYEKLTELINFMSYHFATNKQKYRIDVMLLTKSQEERLTKDAIKIVEMERGIEGELEKLREARDEASKELQRSLTTDEMEAAQERFNIAQKAFTDYGKLVKDAKRVVAEANIGLATDDFKVWREEYETALDNLIKMEDNMSNWDEAADGLRQTITGVALAIGALDEGETIGDETDLERLRTMLTANRALFAEKEAWLRLLQKELDMPNPTDPNVGEDRENNRRIRMAQEYLETNRAIIESKRTRLDVVKAEMRLEGRSAESLLKLMEEERDLLNEIALLQKEDDDTKAETRYNKEIARWEASITAFKEGSEKYKEQAEQMEIGIKAAKDRYEEQKEVNNRKYLRKLEQNYKEHQQRIFRLMKQELEYDKTMLAGAEGIEARYQQIKIDNIAKGTEVERLALQELERIRIKYHNKQQLRMIAYFKQLRDMAEPESDMWEYWNSKMLEAQSNLQKFRTDLEETFLGEGALANWINQFSDWFDQFSTFMDKIHQNQLDRINQEIQAEEEKYNRLLELAKNDAKEKEIIERNKEIRMKQLEEERRVRQIRQARWEKAQAIARASMDVALAVTRTLAQEGFPGIALSAVTAALASANLAAIVATPIPQYAQGGRASKDEIAMINDGGSQEFVQRGGTILTAPSENALVPLKRGDIIHKDYEALQNSSLFYKLSNSQASSKQRELKDMTLIIESAISNGFNKAKINNNVSVLNKVDSYKQRMKSWN